VDVSLAVSKRFMTPEETADYLCVSKKKVYKLVQSRSIPFIRLDGGKLLRFDVNAINKWLEKKLVPSKPVQ